MHTSPQPSLLGNKVVHHSVLGGEHRAAPSWDRALKFHTDLLHSSFLQHFKIHFLQKILISEWEKKKPRKILRLGQRVQIRKKNISEFQSFSFLFASFLSVSNSALVPCWAFVLLRVCLCLLVQWPPVWDPSHIHRTHIRMIPGGASTCTTLLYNHTLYTALHWKQ